MERPALTGAESQAFVHITHRGLEDITLRNQLQSPLLCLPTELRDKIFKYALGDWQVHMMYNQVDIKKKAIYCKCMGFPKDQYVPTTSTIIGSRSMCRQLYGETRLLAFGLNIEFGWQTEWCGEILFKRLDKEKFELFGQGRWFGAWCE
jgi:hypothetical protein